MKTSRRTFLASAAALAGAAALPVTHAQSRRTLRIPALLDARAGPVALVAAEGQTAFYPGVASGTAGYNGSYLGPTLRVHRGDDVPVAVTNRLAVDTTVHWHGLLIPGDLDGGPHQLVLPGATWRPVLPIRQPGATLFYHSHVHHATADQVYRGLAGMMIVHDPAEDALGLPSTYGVDDLPVILQDRKFAGGRMVKPEGMMSMMQGARGDTVLVNGTPDALARVPGGLVRLRLLNASNARAYHLSFTDARTFHWIATDGGLLESPLPRRSISLMPGERAEIVVDFSSGGKALLFTAPDDNAARMGMMDGYVGGPLPVLAFEATRAQESPALLPSTLVRHEVADIRSATRTRRFTLDMGMMGMGGMGMGGMGMGMGMGGRGMGMGRRGGGMGGMGGGDMDMFTINGRPFDMARIDEHVRLGDTEIWEITADMMSHPFHVHGVHFQVIGRGSGGPGPDDAGVKDTVRVDDRVRLLVRFTQPSRGRPYMHHCHILEHEDMGMMGQFTVA